MRRSIPAGLTRNPRASSRREHLEGAGGGDAPAPAAAPAAAAPVAAADAAAAPAEAPAAAAAPENVSAGETDKLLSAEEKRALDRAARFGVAAAAASEAKLNARAARFGAIGKSLDDVAAEMKGAKKTGGKDIPAKEKTPAAPLVSEEELERMKSRAAKFGVTSKIVETEEKRKKREEMQKIIDERAKRFKAAA